MSLVIRAPCMQKRRTPDIVATTAAKPTILLGSSLGKVTANGCPLGKEGGGGGGYQELTVIRSAQLQLIIQTAKSNPASRLV
jgi:hypothetical protein